MKYFIFLFTVLFSLSSQANRNFEVSGFGSLGFVQVNSKQYGFRTDVSYDDGSFKGEWDPKTLSILGVQPEYRFSDQFDLVTQFVYRNQNDFTLDSATRMAFLRYRPNVDWAFRAGRTAIDIFHLSEYTDVGFAYPWAKVPTEVYGLITYRHLDGIDATRSFKLDGSTIHAKLFAGTSEAGQSNYQYYGEVGIDDVWGGSLEWDAVEWVLKGNLTSVNIKNDIPPTAFLAGMIAQTDPLAWPGNLAYANQFSIANADVLYASISGKMYLDEWMLMGELSRIQADNIFIRPTNIGYFNVVYNYENHAFFANYGFSDTEAYEFNENVNNNLLPPFLVPSVEAAANFLRSNQRSVSLGWRWDVVENVAIKAQVERADIKENGSALWLNNNYLSSPAEIVHSFYFNVSFVF